MTNDEGPLTITAAAPLIRDGVLTPSELLERCLARIDRYEPRVRAWAYLDRERARREAEQLTDELKRGHHRGPLHGIPVGVKDIIDVFDMPTGCGSKLWANSYARRDAAVVERLRQAGALILGKTVTTPYAFLDPPPTRNPWNAERTPGGSSSGSAAAVACGMCLATLGTQTGGSVTRPASYCGVCSLKPTWGRVSVDGVLPLAPSLDHVGVMANCVRDLATVFQVIAGPDPKRGFTFASHGPIPDVLRSLESDPFDPSDLVRLTGLFGDQLSPALRPAFESAVDRLTGNAIPRQTGVPPASFAAVPGAHRVIMSVEAAEYHGDRIARHPDDYPPNIRGLIKEGMRIPAVAYRQARVLRDQVEEEVTAMVAGVRYFLTPATVDFPPDPSTTGSPAFNAPWSFLGHPTVSVPAGWSADGLPFAVQLVGSPLWESDLLVAAAWCEQTLQFPRRAVPVS
jgi:aspartyl-tRNA(Asn)/glutamyl-tRNA(Gln) amidotransferase subunit A